MNPTSDNPYRFVGDDEARLALYERCWTILRAKRGESLRTAATRILAKRRRYGERTEAAARALLAGDGWDALAACARVFGEPRLVAVNLGHQMETKR